jgi:hypothetical protein
MIWEKTDNTSDFEADPQLPEDNSPRYTPTGRTADWLLVLPHSSRYQ